MSDKTRALNGLATDAVQELWEKIERGNKRDGLEGVVVADFKAFLARPFIDCSVALQYGDDSIVIRKVSAYDADQFCITNLYSTRWSEDSFWNYRKDFTFVGLLTKEEVEEQESIFRGVEAAEKLHEDALKENRQRDQYKYLKLKFEGEAKC